MEKILITILVCFSLSSISFRDLDLTVNTVNQNKYCFDDSYGSGNKFEIVLIDGGKSTIVIKNRNNEVIRTGTGTWSGTNDGPGGNSPTIRLNLSTGVLRFTAIVNRYSSSIDMLIDSKDNQWIKCQ